MRRRPLRISPKVGVCKDARSLVYREVGVCADVLSIEVGAVGAEQVAGLDHVEGDVRLLQ